MNTVSTLTETAEKELQQDKERMTIHIIKDRIREIELAERTLAKLRNQYKILLSKDLDDVYYENISR